VKLPANANVRAAIFATCIVFIATTILWYGALGVYAHLPPPPEWLGIPIYLVCSVLGAPGLLIGGLIHPRSGDLGIFVEAPLIAWVFYFIVCRAYIGWRDQS
jgi:hypothetical protein